MISFTIKLHAIFSFDTNVDLESKSSLALTLAASKPSGFLGFRLWLNGTSLMVHVLAQPGRRALPLDLIHPFYDPTNYGAPAFQFYRACKHLSELKSSNGSSSSTRTVPRSQFLRVSTSQFLPINPRHSLCQNLDSGAATKSQNVAPCREVVQRSCYKIIN